MNELKIEWARKEGQRWVVECRTAAGSLVEYCARTLPAALALAERYGAKWQTPSQPVAGTTEEKTMSDNYSHDVDATSADEREAPRDYSGADFAMLFVRAGEAGMGYSLSTRNFHFDDPARENVAVALWWHCRDQDTYDTQQAREAIALGRADEYSLPLVYCFSAAGEIHKRELYEKCEDFIIAKEKENAIAAGNEFFGGAL